MQRHTIHSLLLAILAASAVALVAGGQDLSPSARRGQRGGQGELVSTIREVGAVIQESAPPSLLVSVSAIVPNTGYTNVRLVRADYDRPPADGIQDYYLYAIAPTRPVAQLLTEVRATDTWQGYRNDAPWLRGIRVHGEGEGVKVIQVGGGDQPNPGRGRGRGRDAGRGPLPQVREFVGTSRRGSFDEALNNALVQLNGALNEGGLRDGMAEWELKGVSGRLGGFAGFTDLTVTITARRSPAWAGQP